MIEGQDRRRAGRPPALDPAERRRRILDAAERLFSAGGYAATNMDRVARECRMSKQSVYGVFANKETLFAALVGESVPAEEPLPDAPFAGDLESELIALLRKVAMRALASRQIAMTRLVVEEAHAAPELAQAFYEKSVARGRSFLRRHLNAIAVRRRLTFLADFDSLSDLLFGAVVGGAMVHALIGDPSALTPEAIDARIRAAARIFAQSAASASD